MIVILLTEIVKKERTDMANLYRVTNVQVEHFITMYSLNKFLKNHSGNIIDIQTVSHGSNSNNVSYTVIYQATEED